ncbi:MAG: hypothetical protein ACOCYW_06360 [Roseicyclus sp.]
MKKTDTETHTDREDGARTAPGGGEGREGAHTELRRAGTQPRPRAKVLPPDDDDEPGADDPFNDMPV